MSDSRRVERVVFFCDGSMSTRNNTPDNILGRLAASLMHHPNNSILQLFQNCEEQNKYYFDGPGADICSNKTPGLTLSKVVGSIGGAIDGHFGTHGIGNSLKEITEIILKLSDEARKNNKKLEIHVHSWSRGGFLAWKIKKLLAELLEDNRIDVDSLYLINIDPVAGGPFDRFNLWMKSNKKDPNIPIYSITYYSDNGNLKNWPFQFNTIFFSGLILDEDHPNAERYIVRVHHEGIVGRSGNEVDPNHPDKLAGEAVLGDIVKKSPLKFAEGWTEIVIKNGERALQETAKQNLVPQTNRAFLSPKTTRTCFLGDQKRDFKPLTELTITNAGDPQDSNEINLGDMVITPKKSC